MDLAIKINIDESPLTFVSNTKTQVPVFTRHILRIDTDSQVPEHDYIQESIYFTHFSLLDAITEVNKQEAAYDAILINVSDIASDFGRLKGIAKTKALPLIIYTPKFDERVKDLALSLGADEYHYGAITYPFLKRIEFIRKLKHYKNERGDKPYKIAQPQVEIPKIKLWALKRTFDFCVALGALICLSPIMVIVAILIKLESKGPIFYISKRAGAGYKIFDFYKFRSMRTGADAELAKLAHLNQYDAAGQDGKAGVFFKFKNDPRVTRIGNFLRNTSLDEIPQLLNVLKGDMSLVGNRPLPLYEAEKLTNDQIAWRFLAPAGITGLWQVTKRGKGDMSPEERIALDMEYAIKNSFFLDMKILLSTIPALLQKEQV
jgi:lipopolysaccharide/colanic/teichoic acid biosynthesis glycosyltransferase